MAKRGAMTVRKQVEAAVMQGVGIPQKKIAKKMGVTQQAISRHLNKDELKQIVVDAQSKMVTEFLQPALDNVSFLLSNYRETITIKGENDIELKIPVLSKEQMNHAWDATKVVLTCVGISPYPSESKLVQYIYNEIKQVFMSPNMALALEKYGQSLKLPENKPVELIEGDDYASQDRETA